MTYDKMVQSRNYRKTNKKAAKQLSKLLKLIKQYTKEQQCQ